MNPELSGTITKGIYTKILSYADKIIDNKNPCWINFSKNEDAATTETRIIEGTHMVYIPGEDKKFTKLICNQIANSHELIVLSSFLLQSGDVTDSLLQRASQGVPVIILSAYAEDFDKTKDDELPENVAKIIEEHKQLLDTLAGKILVRTAPHFHTKFILCDPNSERSSGIMMTCNATVDAMNGKNIELGIVLTKDEIKSFFSFFLQGFWKESKHELFVPRYLGSVNKDSDADVINLVNFGHITNPVTCQNNLILKEKVIETINSANKSIDIGAWTFNHPEVLDLIQTKAKNGVKVNLYAHISLLNSEKLAKLIASGIIVYGHKRLHAKFVFADETHGIVMTSNIAGYGLDEGFESGILFTSSEADTVLKIIKEIASSCTYRYLFNPRIGDVIPGLEGYMFNKESPSKFVSIRSSEEHQLKRNIKSPVEMVKPLNVDNAIQKQNSEIHLYQRELVTIDFTPDILPPKEQLEKEASSDSRVQLYFRKDNKTKKYVCVKKWEDMPLIEEFTKKGYNPVITE